MARSRLSSLTQVVPKSFLIRLGVGVALVNLFVMTTAGVFLWKSLRSRRDHASVMAQNLSLALDHFVADTFGQADAALWAVKDEAERLAADPRSEHRDLDAFIRRQHERSPGLLALRVTDAQGLVIRGSGPRTEGQIRLADRDYFLRLQREAGSGLVISQPLIGRVVGKWVIVAARRLERPDHAFAGIVYAVMAVEPFQKAFSALDLGAHGSVALRDLDLGLIARYPDPGSAGTAVGQRTISQEARAFVRTGQTAGTYRAVTPFDQVRRTFAIRKVSGHPFYLLVGLADQDYLAAWWREVFQEALEVVLFVSLTGAASWLVYRAWVRQQAAHAHLEGLLAEVKTLGGMLPICSHCKKIRDDKGYWNQLEAYLNEHTDAEFTHGICPDCAREAFPRRPAT